MPSAAAATRRGSLPGGRSRRAVRGVLLLLGVAWAATGWYYATRSLPAGIRVAGEWLALPAGDAQFLRDVTAADGFGRALHDQQIFDRALAIIHDARRFIVLDYYLFDPEAPGRGSSSGQPVVRPLSSELERALLARKREVPDLAVLFVTDPINDDYGLHPSPAIARLRAAGITVVETDLDRLPDGNPIYSGLWRLGVRWWTRPVPGGDLVPRFGAWSRALNYKANHRKVLIADDGAGRVLGLISSANPHDPSSGHSNVALELTGDALQPLLESEFAIARSAGWVGVLPLAEPSSPERAPGSERAFAEGRQIRVRVLTEGAIRAELLDRIGETVRGESIDVAMLYLSDRDVMEALRAAAARGVIVRVLLDPNKDALGDEQAGLPNRQAASELIAASGGAIKVRWYRTHGEQFHTKLVSIYGRDRVWFALGSANLTRRNLGDFDLEADAAVEASRSTAIADQVLRYFEMLWSNRGGGLGGGGVEYSSPYEVYADPSQSRYWLYRLLEGTGVAPF